MYRQDAKRPGRAAAGRYEYGTARVEARAEGDEGIIARYLAQWGLTPAEAAKDVALAAALVLLAFAMVWAMGASYEAGYAAGVRWSQG